MVNSYNYTENRLLLKSVSLSVNLLLKDILEDVFEPSIIGFKNGVLCAHVQRPLLANGVLEAAVCKACNRLGGAC